MLIYRANWRYGYLRSRGAGVSGATAQLPAIYVLIGRKWAGATDGNLGSHLRKLEAV
jgi:hypothetical protein